MNGSVFPFNVACLVIGVRPLIRHALRRATFPVGEGCPRRARAADMEAVWVPQTNFGWMPRSSNCFWAMEPSMAERLDRSRGFCHAALE